MTPSNAAALGPEHRQVGTTLESAREMVLHGWAVIPLQHGKKAPQDAEWQHLRISEQDLPQHFRNGSNIGVLLGEASNGLVDVDLDTDEAIALADEFLPPTLMHSGHQSRPRSHAWYRVTDSIPESSQFRDTDKRMLLELRATGQTVIPPSLHPSGETYAWEGPLEPAAVTKAQLQDGVARLATACLLARSWPKEPGQRHEIANALAGFLLRAEWEQDAVAHLVKAVGRVAGDEEAERRVSDSVDATTRTLSRGGRATGGPTLVELLGGKVVSKIKDWLMLNPEASEPTHTYGIPTTRFSAEKLPSIPPAVLHGITGDFIRAVEPHTEAHPMAIVVQFLAAFGNVIGSGPHFRVEADRHSLKICPILVGRTAKGRKGTSWGYVHRLFEQVDPQWALDRIQGGLSSGEGLIFAVRDPSPSDPGASDKRLFVLESEFASALKVMSREGNTLSAEIRQAWDSGNLRLLTKNSPLASTGSHISIVGHITKDELLRYLDRTEMANGLANRFLWIAVERSKFLPEGGRLNEKVLAEFATRLSTVVSFASSVGEVRRDEDASALWREVYPQLADGKPGLFGAVISRAEAQVMRLSALYALLDRSQTIQRSHVEAALGLWSYAEQSCRQIFGEAVGDPVADAILSRLRGTPEGLTRTDIRNMFSNNRQKSEIDRALRVLEESSLARSVQVDTGGRPAEWWFGADTPFVVALNRLAAATTFEALGSAWADVSKSIDAGDFTEGQQDQLLSAKNAQKDRVGTAPAL